MARRSPRRSAISVALQCSAQGELSIAAAAEEKAADEILKIARRYGVPVRADALLAERLLQRTKESDPEVHPPIFRGNHRLK